MQDWLSSDLWFFIILVFVLGEMSPLTLGPMSSGSSMPAVQVRHTVGIVVPSHPFSVSDPGRFLWEVCPF